MPGNLENSFSVFICMLRRLAEKAESSGEIIVYTTISKFSHAWLVRFGACLMRSCLFILVICKQRVIQCVELYDRGRTQWNNFRLRHWLVLVSNRKRIHILIVWWEKHVFRCYKYRPTLICDSEHIRTSYDYDRKRIGHLNYIAVENEVPYWDIHSCELGLSFLFSRSSFGW